MSNDADSEQDFVTAQQSVVSTQDKHEPSLPTVFVGTVTGVFVQVNVDVSQQSKVSSLLHDIAFFV